MELIINFTSIEINQYLDTQKYLHIILICSILQLFFPFKQKSYPIERFKSWYISFITGSLNWCLHVIFAWLLTPIVSKLSQFTAISYFKEINPIIRLIFLLFLNDTIIYWCHYLFHSFSFLRKIHNVHHVENHVDAITSIRLHFLEYFAFAFVNLVVFAFFDVTVNERILIVVIFQIASVTSHTDFRLPYQLEMIIDKLFVTSGFHMHHHSQNTIEANENLGLLFNIWDRINNTYHAPEKDRKYEFGTRTEDKMSNSLVKNIFLKLPYNNGAGLRGYKRKKD